MASWLLIGVAVLVVLGHICALPVHVHAGAVTTHSEDHPEQGSDEATHGGSCETLRTSPTCDAPVLIPTGFALPVIGGPHTRLAHSTLVPAPTSLPPLFLLHGSLLI